MEIKVIAKSSGDSPYTVSFFFEGTKVFANCTCKASEFNIMCKHRIALASGDPSMLYNQNEKNKLDKIVKCIQKTDLEPLVSDFNQIRVSVENGQKRLKQLKRLISQKMQTKT